MPKAELALESFSFTLRAGEASLIYMMLKEEGFEASSQGLKEFLLKIAKGEEAESEEEEAAPEASVLSSSLKKIIEVAEQNPEVTQMAIKKGGQLLGSLLKKIG